MCTTTTTTTATTTNAPHFRQSSAAEAKIHSVLHNYIITLSTVVLSIYG